MKNSNEEGKKRAVVQLIQSRCVHRRRGIVKGSDIVYCQDCEKILYHLDGKVIQSAQSRCVHLRRAIIGWAKLRHQKQIVNKYRCQDCGKTLYDREKRGDENGT